MDTLDKATETQLNNIQSKTGKSLDELNALMRQSGLTKHSELRSMVQKDMGLGYGDANLLASRYLAASTASTAEPAPEDVLAQIHAGPKAQLRPIHDALTAAIDGFGPYDVSPKKGYVSLRRKKQFAMVGPTSQARVELGLNMKGIDGTERLLAQPAGSMCQYIVRLTTVADVDTQVLAWLKQAYDSAG